MSHQKRNRRIVDEFVGHPTEQPLTQGQMTIPASAWIFGFWS